MRLPALPVVVAHLIPFREHALEQRAVPMTCSVHFRPTAAVECTSGQRFTRFVGRKCTEQAAVGQKCTERLRVPVRAVKTWRARCDGRVLTRASAAGLSQIGTKCPRAPPSPQRTCPQRTCCVDAASRAGLCYPSSQRDDGEGCARRVPCREGGSPAESLPTWARAQRSLPSSDLNGAESAQ